MMSGVSDMVAAVSLVQSELLAENAHWWRRCGVSSGMRDRGVESRRF